MTSEAPDGPLAAFDAAVDRAGQRPALRWFGRTWTWDALRADVDAFAVALVDLGVARGDRVGVQLQNVPASPVTHLALWRIGAVVVAVNPMYRAREVHGLLTTAGATALVTHEHAWPDLAEDALPDGVRLVVTSSALAGLDDHVPDVLAGVESRRDPSVPDLDELVRAHAGRRPDTPHGPDPEGLAALVFTSGTTGPPKGAMLSHAKMALASHTYVRWHGVDGDDEVVLGFAPFSHVTGLVGVMGGWLTTAATLVLPYRFEPRLALRLVAEERVTWTVGVITAFIALHEVAGEADVDTSSLRVVLSGGAPIAPAAAAAFSERFGVEVLTGFGMTETTMLAAGTPAGAHAPVDPGTGALSVGLPSPGFEIRVVGDDGTDLAHGHPGELVVRGPTVFDGYWDDPAATAQVLDADGWLRTGDVGVVDDAGWCFVVDRKKDLIVTSGYKVWPREVEDVLHAHPAVRDAAVVGVPDGYRGEEVRAFVSLRQGATATADDLRAWCRDRLATYKAPRTVEVLGDLPRSASGKVLRRHLRRDG